MYVIVGLGNPGDKYAKTRHNVGFDVLDRLASRLGIAFNRSKCKAHLAEGRIGSERVVLAQPQTFMNLSGESVVELMNWYKAEMDHLVVVYDDIDLELGHVRFRAKGGAGTHNGMRSIIGLLGRDDFPRVRVGTGSAPKGWNLADWVLSGYRTEEERRAADEGYEDACDVICELVERGSEAANRLSGEKSRKFAPAKPRNEKARYDFSNVALHFKEKIDARDIAGSACAVAVGGRIVYQNMQGFSDIEGGRRVTRDTLFRLASMTKPITGVAMMILKERGLVDFDAPIEKYLPEMADMQVAIKDEESNVIGTEAAKRSITMRDLLTHSSGLGQGEQKGVPSWNALTAALPDEEYTLEGIVRESGRALLDFQPGACSGYSAVAGMNLLARVCEVVTGMSYPAFLSTEIFNPLGMSHTTYTPSEREWEQTAQVYTPGTLKRCEIGRRGYDGLRVIYPCGSAGLVGTLGDYLRFAQMLALGGKLGNARILSEESVREMYTSLLPESVPDQPVGCRWGLSMRVTTAVNDDQPLPVGCYGWGGAYGTHFWIDPEKKLAVVSMIAREGGGSDIARQLERDVMAALSQGEKAGV